MIKLTAKQLTILSAASARDDGLVIRPAALRPAGAAKIAAKLLEQGLVRELRAKDDMPAWREEHGKAFSLKILKAGRAAVQAMAQQAVASHASEDEDQVSRSDLKQTGTAVSVVEQAVQTADVGTAKPSSKRTIILALLSREDGATVEAMMSATGWLPHTTRAALSGLRKGGFALTRGRDGEGGASVYRVVPATIAAAA